MCSCFPHPPQRWPHTLSDFTPSPAVPECARCLSARLPTVVTWQTVPGLRARTSVPRPLPRQCSRGRRRGAWKPGAGREKGVRVWRERVGAAGGAASTGRSSVGAEEPAVRGTLCPSLGLV
ncbi:hypothetical protein NDU88_006054 [Pleurodeles waltl]|uniref:Uncharacterized protein n=1 Tax=Pleurodeles waltl TaxID=8319 RepID=A0AAV7MD00_PLEWA|nr:hypothetical protein NDU88_006054 [Pleurodeles waltl]